MKRASMNEWRDLSGHVLCRKNRNCLDAPRKQERCDQDKPAICGESAIRYGLFGCSGGAHRFHNTRLKSRSLRLHNSLDRLADKCGCRSMASHRSRRCSTTGKRVARMMRDKYTYHLLNSMERKGPKSL